MTRAIPFDHKALQRVFEIARGVPRRINLLCDRAMLGAYAHGQHHVDVAIVEKSAREVFGSSESSGPDRSFLGTTAGIGLVAAAGLALITLLAFAIYGGYRYFATPQVAASAARSAAPAASAASAASAVSAVFAASAAAPSATSGPKRLAPAAPATLVLPALAAAASGAAAASTTPDAPAKAATAVPAASSASNPASHANLAMAVPVSPIETVAELETQLKTLGGDETAAWRELAPLWKVHLDAGEPCAVAARQHLRCYRFVTTLALLRSLDRPGFMTLREDRSKMVAVAVVLVGLNGDQATLSAKGQDRLVSIEALRKLWTGEFGTLWRLPPGYTTALAEGATGPLVDRLAEQLASLAGEEPPDGTQTLDAALRAKLVRFQTSHGLSGIGKAGPTTFMQLNRATNVDEPTLRTGAAER